QYLSFLYIVAGNKLKAQEHLKTALEIDPLSQETLFFSAYFDYMTEEYPSALAKLNKCIDVNPRNIPAHSVKCYCLLRSGQYDEVIDYFSHYPSDIFIPEETKGIKALAYALKKDFVKATKGLDELITLSSTPDGFRLGTFLFLLYATLGENDKAFEWIDTAIKNKSPLLLIHFVDPLVDSLKSDPRYAIFQKEIFGSIDLPEVKNNKKALLDDNEVSFYMAKLKQHIVEHKPFLDPDLSLRMLAEQIELHPNALSWLLNEHIGKNFNDFINYYRVESFKLICKDPKNSHLSLIGMANDSGFNSKTVFNNAFKKETGLTPKQFFKSTIVNSTS
ncbi:MAG: helix-turn-helix domain-containing protein, partial [Flavisolibacter sp.]